MSNSLTLRYVDSSARTQDTGIWQFTHLQRPGAAEPQPWIGRPIRVPGGRLGPTLLPGSRDKVALRSRRAKKGRHAAPFFCRRPTPSADPPHAARSLPPESRPQRGRSPQPRATPPDQTSPACPFVPRRPPRPVKPHKMYLSPFPGLRSKRVTAVNRFDRWRRKSTSAERGP